MIPVKTLDPYPMGIECKQCGRKVIWTGPGTNARHIIVEGNNLTCSAAVQDMPREEVEFHVDMLSK